MIEQTILNTIDPEPERAVLASIFWSNAGIQRIGGVLMPDCFADPRNRTIYQVMLDLAGQKHQIDEVTVLAQIRADRLMAAMGGTEAEGVMYVAETPYASYAGAAVEPYAELVYDAWRRREIASGAEDIVKGHGDPALAQTFAERLKTLAANSMQPQAASFKDELMKLGLAIENGKGHVRFLKTHVSQIDAHSIGMTPGFCTVIAARPGEGKTTLGTQIALRNALAGEPALIVSMEMFHEDLTARMSANLSSVPSNKLIAAIQEDFTETDWDRLTLAWDKSSAALKMFGDGRRLTLGEIRAAVAYDHAERGTRLVFVDHLSQIVVKAKTIYEAQTERIYGLADIAKDFKICMPVSVQLNRAGTDEPRLHHLEGSGAIEQLADMVLLLWAPWEKSDDGEEYQRKDVLHCRIAKARNGKTGFLKLDWIPEFSRIGGN